MTEQHVVRDETSAGYAMPFLRLVLMLPESDDSLYDERRVLAREPGLPVECNPHLVPHPNSGSRADAPFRAAPPNACGAAVAREIDVTAIHELQRRAALTCCYQIRPCETRRVTQEVDGPGSRREDGALRPEPQGGCIHPGALDVSQPPPSAERCLPVCGGVARGGEGCIATAAFRQPDLPPAG